jgi:hypothetical protein
MATLTAYKPVDMFSPDVWHGTVRSYGARHITISDGYHSGTYFGSFNYSSSGLSGGTVTGYDYYEGGVLQGRVRGASVNILTLAAYLDDGNVQGASAYVFRGDDTFRGSIFSDQIRGYNGSDDIYGHGGRDKLQGDGGNDFLSGGNGKDILIWGIGDTHDGGDNIDTLLINSGDVDLRKTDNSLLLNLEQIDLRPGAHELTLNRSDVLHMSPTNQLKILGDSSDTVNISGGFTPGSTTNGYTLYSFGGGASLLIDADVQVF